MNTLERELCYKNRCLERWFILTREQARTNLESLGFPEVTEEMVSNYLNQVMGETKKFSDRADKFKDDAAKAAELQKKLDEIAKQNMSDIDKANTDKEEALSKVSELEAKIKSMEIKTALAEKGIIGEDSDKLIESLNSGTFDVELLGKIILERENAAATAKEKEIAENASNPGGGKAGGEDKPADVVNAESMAAAFGTKAESDKQNYYVLH